MLNKVMLIGNLGKDPELRYTSGGQAVCDFNVATSESFNDREGQKQERTEWHRVVVWARQAENCKRYLTKGSKVFVEGRLQTREWEDKSGAKRYTTEIVAQNVRFLSGKGSGGGFDEPPPPSDDYAPSYAASGPPSRRSGQQDSGGGSYSRSGPPPGGHDDMPPLDDDLPF